MLGRERTLCPEDGRALGRELTLCPVERRVAAEGAHPVPCRWEGCCRGSSPCALRRGRAQGREVTLHP